MPNTMFFSRIVFLFLLLLSTFSFSQRESFLGRSVTWAEDKLDIPSLNAEQNSADVLILHDYMHFYFYALNNERLERNIVFKVNTESGAQKLKKFTLPESFDAAFDAGMYKQGRSARIQTPFILEYKLLRIAARKFAEGKWVDLKLNYKYETVRRTYATGEFLNDEIMNLFFPDLKAGEILEIFYEASFNSDYGSNLFYFNSRFPKVHCKYDFTYKMQKWCADYEFICPVNIRDSLVKRSRTENDEYQFRTDEINMYNISAINYPTNCFEGKTLPHVFADFEFYRVAVNSYNNSIGKVYEIATIRPKNFEWLILKDTNNHYFKVYDHQFTNLRKFVSTLPRTGSDSLNRIFFKALCDTFNNFRYISANHLFYNESHLADIYSADHLLKRRLPEPVMYKVYKDIFEDNNIFYYIVNVQDRRYGEHETYRRVHSAYEVALLAIPVKDSYVYFMPRYDGIKYHMNELPFYLEGSLASLYPKNFQDNTKNKADQYLKFIKTHAGTCNENTRTENATVKIFTDSLKAHLTIKESLSGQFSTVLRHYYLGEYIDSTISPAYFKRCTQKPYALGPKHKLSSNISEFPFRYTFNCAERVALQKPGVIDLTDWFSFLVSKKLFPELPRHDYYFDFDYSDSYNFLLDFDKPVELLNAAEFGKKVSNEFFDLDCEIMKNSETNYLLKVRVGVKKRRLPAKNGQMLTDMITALDQVNAFNLNYRKLN